ncbi:MAG: GCN5-related N-acetyltransferase [Pseudonocardiales bacterium]|nr:GCN5-related N-acetyltransferase [Pseudonocardiales bacterium]
MSPSFAPDFPIQTARLDLRPHRMSDLDDLVEFHSDPGVVRYIPWPVRDREATRATLRDKLARHTLTGAGQWLVLAVELRETGKVIGEILLKWESEEHRQGEIGYAYNAAFHRQGFATEAAAAILDYGFSTMALHRIVGKCDARNHGSARVLAGLGLRLEGTLRECEFFKGEWTDEQIFAILSTEWAARRTEQP